MVIRPLAGPAEAAMCASLMAASEPWVTLRRSYEASLRMMTDPTREVSVAVRGADVVGFVIVCMTGAFVGYIQTVCVAPAERGRGLGTRLVRHAEERIFRESPNAFLCVSSFNPDARRFYERLGYETIGALADYLVQGHAEILMRKTRGPWSEFTGQG
jgi:ribosomal protein S18 acetylase RimI-like enzyme